MQRERLTDSIMVFRSDRYAQVTCGLVLTDSGAVLIDSLLYPDETRRIRRYVEKGLRQEVVCFIMTHYHADHTTGACLFPDARLIAHSRCRDLLDTRGRDSLQELQDGSGDFDGIQIALPHIVFDQELTLQIGNVNFRLRHSPGHSADQIMCLLEDDEVLFASDAVLPMPFFADGDFDECRETLCGLRGCEYENVVQGHGDIVLRGEFAEKLESDIAYLDRLESAVVECMESGMADVEERVKAEDCGKSGALLNGAGAQLHQQNTRGMIQRYRRLREEKASGALL